MAWTELHDTLPDHPKIKYLAAELGCTKGHAVGVVVSLWCHTLRYGKSGEIRLSYVRGLLADIGGTDVDGAISALQLCGWIDPGETDQTVMCHDWDDYAGRLEMIRERDKLRKQADRAELKRLRKTSNGHPKDVRKSPEESAQPNPTQPDQTKPTTLPPTAAVTKPKRESWAGKWEPFLAKLVVASTTVGERCKFLNWAGGIAGKPACEALVRDLDQRGWTAPTLGSAHAYFQAALKPKVAPAHQPKVSDQYKRGDDAYGD